MAKRITTPAKVQPSTPAPAKVVSPVRNTAIPRATTVKKEITHEMIAKRAYEIALSGKGGSELENWLKAERELKA